MLVLERFLGGIKMFGSVKLGIAVNSLLKLLIFTVSLESFACSNFLKSLTIFKTSECILP